MLMKKEATAMGEMNQKTDQIGTTAQHPQTATMPESTPLIEYSSEGYPTPPNFSGHNP